MSDISGYIKQIETATRGEQVRDAIIEALKTINNGGNVLSLNGISANKFVTRDEWDLVFPLLDHVVNNSDKGVKSSGIYAALSQIAEAIDNFVNRETTSATSITDKLATASTNLTNIAKAIKKKTGDFDLDSPLSDYASAIDSIEGTSDSNLIDITITKNGTYPNIDEGGHSNDIYSSVEVNVQPEIIKNKSITKVDSEGKFTLRIADEEGENKSKDGYDEVSIDVSGQLKDLFLDPSKISTDPAKEVSYVFASNETGETVASADIIGYKKVTLDIREKFAPLEIEIDPSQTEEITYYATAGGGYDGGGTLYGYHTVKVKCVEASGPFTVKFWNENELLKTVEDVPKHGTVTYNGANPTKDGQRFTGWNPKPIDVVKNLDCYAQFEEGTSAIGPSGDVGDSWNDIANNGGADIPIGATKTLFVTEHECPISGTDNPGTPGFFADRPIRMVKVASNWHGHTSVWASQYCLPYTFRLYTQPWAGSDRSTVGLKGSDLANYLDNEFLSHVAVDRDTYGDAAELAQGIKPIRITCDEAYINADLRNGGVPYGTNSYYATIWPPTADEYTEFQNNLRGNEFGTTLVGRAGSSGGSGSWVRTCQSCTTAVVEEERHYKTVNGKQDYDYSLWSASGGGLSTGFVKVRDDDFPYPKAKDHVIAGIAAGSNATWYCWAEGAPGDFNSEKSQELHLNDYFYSLERYQSYITICFCT